MGPHCVRCNRPITGDVHLIQGATYGPLCAKNLIERFPHLANQHTVNYKSKPMARKPPKKQKRSNGPRTVEVVDEAEIEAERIMREIELRDQDDEDEDFEEDEDLDDEEFEEAEEDTIRDLEIELQHCRERYQKIQTENREKQTRIETLLRSVIMAANTEYAKVRSPLPLEPMVVASLVSTYPELQGSDGQISPWDLCNAVLQITLGKKYGLMVSRATQKVANITEIQTR